MRISEIYHERHQRHNVPVSTTTGRIRCKPLRRKGTVPSSSECFQRLQEARYSLTNSISSLTQRTPITAIVGQVNYQQFPLYIEDLASVSDVFAAELPRLTGSYFALPELEPASFEIFLFWLENRALLNKNRKPYNEDRREKFPFMELLQLYIFASLYDIPQFREDVFEAFVASTDERSFLISRAEVEKAFEPLRHPSHLADFIEASYTFEPAPVLKTPSGNPNPPPRPAIFVVRLRDDWSESATNASSEDTLSQTSSSSTDEMIGPPGPGYGKPSTRPLPPWLAFILN